MPIKYDNSWAVHMTIEQMQDRLKVLDDMLQGKTKRGLGLMIKKQRQEILNELELRETTCQKEDPKGQKQTKRSRSRKETRTTSRE